MSDLRNTDEWSPGSGYGNLSPSGGPDIAAFHRPSVRSTEGDRAARIKMLDAERRTRRAAATLIQRGESREAELFKAMGSGQPFFMADIDSASVHAIAASVSDSVSGGIDPRRAELVVRQEIMKHRKIALMAICSNERIRDLYHSNYHRVLPTPEELPHLQDDDVASLVHELALAASEWEALPDWAKSPYGEVHPTVIFDHLENLEKILEARLSFRRQKMVLRTDLEQAMGRLSRTGVTVSPEFQTELAAIALEGLGIADALDKESMEPAQLAVLPDRVRSLCERACVFDNEVIRSLMTDLGVSFDTAKALFDGAASNWRGFYQIMPDGLVRQTHNIKGLKLYFLPGTTTIVADFGKGTIGEGTYKRAKSTARIGDTGAIVQENVRLTSKTKTLPQPRTEAERKQSERLQYMYDLDIGREKGAREALSGIPNIAGMTEIQYYSKSGVLKTRYVMPRYISDLRDVITKQGPGPSLHCCAGVVGALSKIHERGLVYLDLKPGNVLTDGKEGFLTDFGLLRRTEAPITFIGSLAYMAPETVFDRTPANPKMDEFSLGILLLGSSNPERYVKWISDIQELDRRVQEARSSLGEERAVTAVVLRLLSEEEKSVRSLPDGDEKAQRQHALAEKRGELEEKLDVFDGRIAELEEQHKKRYTGLHNILLRDLRQQPSPLNALITSLIDKDPAKRPDAKEVAVALENIAAR